MEPGRPFGRASVYANTGPQIVSTLLVVAVNRQSQPLGGKKTEAKELPGKVATRIANYIKYNRIARGETPFLTNASIASYVSGGNSRSHVRKITLQMMFERIEPVEEG